MKRTPLNRRTPLVARSPIPRTGKPGGQGGLTRGHPIRAKRDKPRRTRRDLEAHGIEWGDVRLVIYLRAGGACELCLANLNLANMEGHHRQRRREGVHCPANALALCHGCHMEVHAHPDRSLALHHIVSSFEVDPCRSPVWLRTWVDLSCEGTALPAA